MSYELYEVWAEDEHGHEELIETTKSFKQATELAKKALTEGYVAGIIYKEDDFGDLDEVQRFELD